jgi:hypothetical protein
MTAVINPKLAHDGSTNRLIRRYRTLRRPS